MNASSSCHDIPHCPGLHIDAFRTTKYLQQSGACLILSHYHGDHYGNLPRKYDGPASIHCTPITAKLLKEIHEVSPRFVVQHEYGVTWEYIKDDHEKNVKAQITFYDAHHCPGAALILIELPDSCKVHLHTGDMRFHKKMLNYPRLKQAADERRLDTVWLDTTYALATRKFSFPSQSEAVDETALQVQQVLASGTETQDRTLVLLCCYNIGKEKILWKVAQSTNCKLFASEKKLRMLRICCSTAENEDGDEGGNYSSYFTSDRLETNIHVVPMHTAGKMWPFFQPNYQACAKYAMECGPDGAGKCIYDRVVLFCPTGWAAANNWNRRNSTLSCSKTKIPGTDNATIHVEIRLLPYSEHSNITELQTLVNDHWKPRCIIPTVYKTEAEKRQILNLFRIDEGRAKLQFFQSMVISSESPSAMKAEQQENSPEIYESPDTVISPESKRQHVDVAIDLLDLSSDSTGSDSEIKGDLPEQSNSRKNGDENVEEKLVSMGFSRSIVKNAMICVAENQPSVPLFDAALDYLVSSKSFVRDPQKSNKRRKQTHQTSLNLFLRKSPG